MVNEIKPVEKESVKYQCLAAAVVNLISTGFGMIEGWSSPAIILLTSDETPLPTGKITLEESSWIVSLHCVGSMFGNIFFIKLFGRKLPLTIITIPIIISWLLIWFAQNVYYFYAARLLGGFFCGAGAFTMVPLFLSEISSDRIRGTLMSTVALSETIGIILSLTIGDLFDFYATPKFAIALMAIFAVSICFLPESPLSLMKQNKIAETEKSIRFYRSIRETDNDRYLLDLEFNKIKRTLDDICLERNNRNSFVWSDVPKGVARKAIIIGVVLAAMTQFTGVVAMQAYTANIFQESGSNLSPNMSAVVVGIIQFFGTCVATVLSDRSGRKLLLVVSNTGTAFGLITLGVYMMLRSWSFDIEQFNWIPLASFSFIIFVVALGILTVPIILMSEIMPERIKDAGVSLCMTLLWAFSFTAIKCLPLLIGLLEFHGIMFLFAGICICCTLFTILFVPETKGKSHDEIMISLK